MVEKLQEWGAIQACEDQAKEIIEAAWARLDPLVDESQPIMLRAFGSYVLERHY